MKRQLRAVVVGTSFGGRVHVPALQVSEVQGLLSLQTLQLPPFFPHAPAVFPMTQPLPFQQPVQHAPPWQVPVPPLQGVLSATVPCVQLPAVQLSVLQSFWSSPCGETR